MWQGPEKLRLYFPSNSRRKERVPECFSRVSKLPCAPRSESGKFQPKPPARDPDSNPPSHKIDPSGEERLANPAKFTACSQTCCASEICLCLASASTNA